MGEMVVPADAYYGAKTSRAVENFPVSGKTLPPRFVRALAIIKKCAAKVNGDLGLLSLKEVQLIQKLPTKSLKESLPISLSWTCIKQVRARRPT